MVSKPGNEQQQLNTSPLLTDFHLFEARTSRAWLFARTQSAASVCLPSTFEIHHLSPSFPILFVLVPKLTIVQFKGKSSYMLLQRKCEVKCYVKSIQRTLESAILHPDKHLESSHPIRPTLDSVTHSCSTSNLILRIELNQHDYKLK